jgi:polysaccharide pyruvyl transferase CsaB
MKKILISGYYGFDNAGDEAVLAGLISGLNKGSSAKEFALTALSIAPIRTKALHGIDAVDRYKGFFTAIRNTDLLLSGGGSLLQDVTSAHGIFYYLAVVRIAQILGRKTMFIAQGIGPLTRPRSKKLTTSVANRLDAITVRDDASKSLLETIGVKRPVVVTADPALLLTPTITTNRNGVLLSLRAWPGLPASFAFDLASAIKSTGISKPSALNMHGLADAEAADQILQRLSTAPYAAPAPYRSATYLELLDKVASSELVIGMRLHALIFAAAAGIPMVSLSYDPKVDAFMAALGQSDAVVKVETANRRIFEETIGHVWNSRAKRKTDLADRLPALRQSAQQNSDIALSLLS